MYDDAACFKAVVQYCTDTLEWAVIICTVNEADFDTKTIRISRLHSMHTRFHILLHEVGHVLISRDLDYDDRFSSEEYDKRTKIYHAAVIMEECAAWDRGLRLARTLNLQFDRRKFNATRARMLNTYAQWLCNHS